MNLSKGATTGIENAPHRPGYFDRVGKIAFFIAVLLALVDIPIRYNDHYLFTIINSSHNWVTDYFWLFFTSLGNGVILAVLVGLLLLLDARAFVLGVILLVASSITINGIKVLYPTLRPLALLDSVHVLGPELRSGAFPSGHSASSLALALAMIPYFSFKYYGPGLLVAGLVGISRIFVAAHFPGDVIAGWACAIGLFWATRPVLVPFINNRITKVLDTTEPLIKGLLVTQAALIVFAMFVHPHFFAESRAAAIIISILAALAFWRLYRKNGRSTEFSRGSPLP